MSNTNQISLDQIQEVMVLLQGQSVVKEKLSSGVYDNKPVDTISAAKTTSPVTKKSEEVPLLPLPSTAQPNDGLGNPANLSLVAILGRMLVLLAQSNSLFYTVEWKEGTQDMLLGLQLAPVEANATISSAQLQSEQTQQEASKEYWQGGFAIAGAVVTLGMGAFDCFNTSETTPPGGKVNAEDLSGLGKSSAAGGGLEVVENELESTLRTASSSAEETASSAGGMAKNTVFNVGKFLQQAINAAQIGGIVQSIGAIPAGNCDTKAAELKKEQGEEDATVKLADILNQYYGQAFNRTSELTQSANQNFNSDTQTFETIISSYLSGIQKLYQG